MPDDMRRRAAHYKGVAAGAKRMQAMGHKTASGGSGKPPKKKGCPLLILQVLGLGGLATYGMIEGLRRLL